MTFQKGILTQRWRVEDDDDDDGRITIQLKRNDQND